MHLSWPYSQHLPRFQDHQEGLLFYNQACKIKFNIHKIAIQTNQNLDLIRHEEKLLRKKLLNGTILIFKLVLVPGVYQLLAKGDEKVQQSIYHYTVYEKFGPSLKLCFRFMDKALHLQTISLLAINTLNVLEKIHAKLIVHRNLRPKKILTRIQKSELVIIDFKHAQKYKKQKGTFLPFNENHKLQNRQFLNKYSSLNTHLGLACSPKDDLESLGFIIAYFLRRGQLFKKEGTTHDEKVKLMEELKIRMIPEKFFKDLPNEILQYFQFVRLTDITQYPLQDYDFLKKIFKGLLQKLNGPADFQYEWKSRNKLNLYSEDSYNHDSNTNYLSPNQDKGLKVDRYLQSQIPESQAEEETINKNLTVKFKESDEEEESLTSKMASVKLIQPKFKRNLAKN